MKNVNDLDIWYSAFGGYHLITEMETSHIKNCIKTINKQSIKGPWRLEYLPIFRQELKKRSTPLYKAMKDKQ